MGDDEFVDLLLPVPVEVDMLVEPRPVDHGPEDEEQLLLLPGTDLVVGLIPDGPLEQLQAVIDPAQVGFAARPVPPRYR